MNEENDVDDIEALIDNLSLEMEQKQIQEVKETLPPEIKEIEVKTEDELISIALEKNQEIENMADKAFTLFYKGLNNGTDHSQASKEQMIEALKVRTELNKSIVELAKIKKKQVGSVGVMINTLSPSQAGISLDNIKESFQ